ncbi:MAG TPA: VOC family protein [Melioribacteraceae bacterium]|nr:VOC family protein [Melioribacteraceae bacterium]
MAQKIFVNLPVKDINRSIEFFSKLGYSFNPKFTDQNATCMIVSDDIYVMLLTEKFFRTFTNKEISDAKKSTEVLISLTAENKEAVNQFMARALDAGGKEPREAQDHGWMYGRSFEDLDGHIWEIFYMDESALDKM